MDDGLGAAAAPEVEEEDLVSILLVMDDGLGASSGRCVATNGHLSQSFL